MNWKRFLLICFILISIVLAMVYFFNIHGNVVSESGSNSNSGEENYAKVSLGNVAFGVPTNSQESGEVQNYE